MKKINLCGVALARSFLCAFVSLIAFTPSAQASLLVGTATLNVIDDLTVIETDSGVVEEWLDLTSTKNMSSSTALATLSADGFRFAASDEVSAMFDAFSLPAFSAPALNQITHFGISAADSVSFKTYFGDTANPDLTFGFLFNPNDTGSNNTYVCLGDTCGADGFVRSTASIANSAPTFGNFLVRTAAVPVPATVWLFSSGLIGLASIVRRKKA